jgi:hypothetical protein
MSSALRREDYLAGLEMGARAFSEMSYSIDQPA